MPTNSNNNEEKTVKDVFDTLTEEQKTVVYALIGQALQDAKNSDSEGDDENMKHNIFENDTEENTLSHAEMMDVITDAKRYGSMKESFLEHGITDVDYLFPDATNVTATPEFIKRDTGWVASVMNGVHNTPFSRIKSMFADLTEDEARAKGYIKGKMKKEEVFGLLKRTTTPTTIYKKQKMDRDDVIDITDFDVIAWLKGEMRMMLDEEIARAVLVGDGRNASSDDKINEQNIRPIWTDDDLYTIKADYELKDGATETEKCKAFIRAAVKARKDYKGSGTPVLFTTEDVLTDLLLLEDLNGRVIYETQDKLASALRVSKIETVPVMEELSRTDDQGNSYALQGIIVNLSDYTVGADKGGAVSLFDDFDIDYNAQKYLIETRCSGALTKPYSAIAVEVKTAKA
jgi:HK97 family phage major capsid protein